MPKLYIYILEIDELYAVLRLAEKSHLYPTSIQPRSFWWKSCIDIIAPIHSLRKQQAFGMYEWWITTYGTAPLIMVCGSVGGSAPHSLRDINAVKAVLDIATRSLNHTMNKVQIFYYNCIIPIVIAIKIKCMIIDMLRSLRLGWYLLERSL